MKTLLIVMLLTAWVGAPMASAAPPSRQGMEEVRAVVERSSLSGQEKGLILKKAEEAVRTGIPPEDVAVIFGGGLSKKAAPRSLIGLMDMAIGEVKEGLPPRLILNKIEQGLAKGVVPEKILAVAGRVAGNLRDSREILDRAAKNGMKPDSTEGRTKAIETLSEALERGISKKTLLELSERAVAAKIPLSRFEQAVETLANLKEIGISSDVAAEKIREAIDEKYSEQEIRRMENEFMDGRSGNDRLEGGFRGSTPGDPGNSNSFERGIDQGPSSGSRIGPGGEMEPRSGPGGGPAGGIGPSDRPQGGMGPGGGFGR